MVKSREDSIIEIWGAKYINRDVNRLQEDICATIIQCEPGNTSVPPYPICRTEKQSV